MYDDLTSYHTHPHSHTQARLFTNVYQVTNLGSAGSYGTTPLGLLSTYMGDLTLSNDTTTYVDTGDN